MLKISHFFFYFEGFPKKTDITLNHRNPFCYPHTRISSLHKSDQARCPEREVWDRIITTVDCSKSRHCGDNISWDILQPNTLSLHSNLNIKKMKSKILFFSLDNHYEQTIPRGQDAICTRRVKYNDYIKKNIIYFLSFSTIIITTLSRNDCSASKNTLFITINNYNYKPISTLSENFFLHKKILLQINSNIFRLLTTFYGSGVRPS